MRSSTVFFSQLYVDKENILEKCESKEERKNRDVSVKLTKGGNYIIGRNLTSH